MARKDRTLAGFGDVAGNNNDDMNVNDKINTNNKETEKGDADYLDTLLLEEGPGKTKKHELILVGVYLQPEVARLLDRLGKKGGRGAKSRIANDALKKYFKDKELPL